MPTVFTKSPCPLVVFKCCSRRWAHCQLIPIRPADTCRSFVERLWGAWRAPGGRLRGACRVPFWRRSGACKAHVGRLEGICSVFIITCADSRHAHQLCAQGGAALRRNSALGGLRQTHCSGLYSAQALAIHAVTMRATICMFTMCILGGRHVRESRCVQPSPCKKWRMYSVPSAFTVKSMWSFAQK